MPRTRCLTESELAAFQLGDLPEDVLDPISEHLEVCVRCEQRARQLDAITDPFLESLRNQQPVEESAGSVPTETSCTGTESLDAAEAERSARATGRLPIDVVSELDDLEILGVLGRGGMGTVYKARQATLNRLVALKGMTSPIALPRFRIEAEAVAQLQHPNIVQVFAIEERCGTPLLVLEYIDGPSLEEQAGGRPQAIKASARIVQHVAQAVHYAHRKGIIHRDLKPANILLEMESRAGRSAAELSRAQPKITDFGIARLLQAEARQTLDGTVIGTPQYMAPEQAGAENGRVGPPTDVYSLGVILYELLTGRVPFEGADTLDTLLAVRTQEPVPPRRWRPETPRDLQAVCLKCLEKSPERRYASAARLADDLQRFLNREPVLARPVTVPARIWRWCLRRPALAALSLLLLLGLLVGTAAVWRQWRRAETHLQVARRNAEQSEKNAHRADRERHRAEANVATAHEILALFAAELDKELRDIPEAQPRRRELSLAALKYYALFLGQNTANPRLQHEMARIHDRAAYIELTIGQKGRAIEHYEAAVRLCDSLLEATAGDEEVRTLRARILISLGYTYEKAGHDDRAQLSYDQALADLVDLNARHPGSDDLLHEIARVEHCLGYWNVKHRRLDDAERRYHRSLKLYLRLDPSNPYHRRSLAQLHNDIAYLRLLQNRHDDALAANRLALSMRQQLLDEEPQNPDYRKNIGSSRNHIADVYRAAGDWDLAVEEYRRAIAAQEALASEFPLLVAIREDLVNSWHNLAVTYRLADRHQESLQANLRARDLYGELIDRDPGNSEYRRMRAESLLDAARAAFHEGNFSETARLAQDAVDGYAEFRRRAPQGAVAAAIHNQADCNYWLARALEQLDRPQEALQAYARAIQWQKKGIDMQAGDEGSLRSVLARYRSRQSQLLDRLGGQRDEAALQADMQRLFGTN